MANEDHIDYSKQVFASAVYKGGWDGDLLLMAHEVTDSSLDWFYQRGIHVQRYEGGAQRYKRYGSVVTSKFYLFSPEMRRWKHVVFLDTDMIVRGSLAPLLKNDDLAAVPVPFPPELAWNRHVNQTESTLLEELQSLPGYGAPIFNAGVITFPTSVITDTLVDELFVFVERFQPILVLPDQVAFAFQFHERWEALPYKFNIYRNLIRDALKGPAMQDYMDRLIDETADIIHFQNASPKPWHPDMPYYAEWLENMRLSEQISR